MYAVLTSLLWYTFAKSMRWVRWAGNKKMRNETPLTGVEKEICSILESLLVVLSHLYSKTMREHHWAINDYIKFILSKDYMYSYLQMIASPIRKHQCLPRTDLTIHQWIYIYEEAALLFQNFQRIFYKPSHKSTTKVEHVYIFFGLFRTAWYHEAYTFTNNVSYPPSCVN